jgi:hypothetical protein
MARISPVFLGSSRAAMTPEMAVIEVGRPDHEVQYCAWAFGHPRREVVAMLEAGISASREPIRVRVGIGAKQFEDHEVSKAVYATGWDGTLWCSTKVFPV